MPVGERIRIGAALLSPFDMGYTFAMQSNSVQGQKRIWAARVLIAAVFFINVMCAVQFIVVPADFAPAYQLEGPVAIPIVRSFGICFLMWNATYPPLIVHPERYRMLFCVVIAQQAIGLVGESLLLASLEPGLAMLAASIVRFIVFDAAGLVLLAAAFALVRGCGRLQHSE